MTSTIDDRPFSSAMLMPATRAEGLRRLEDFLPRAGRAYASDRNADLGPRQRANVSQLSPYLRHRLITEREVVEAVLRRHGASAAQKFVQEVLWRTYWKGWLEQRPDIWRRFLDDRDAERDSIGTGVAKTLESAERGDTGIEGFDDWARELVETGYMHNHARMWFASIWIFTLGLPWTLGADFFLRHLVDADPASNTLSWRWVAGLQTRGKTYLATSGNIARYTEERFNPKGLSRTAPPLREPPLPPPRGLRRLGQGHPDRPALLLVTGDDLDPESLFSADAGFASVLVGRGARGWPFGEKATVFVDAAADDAAKRAAAYFRCEVSTCDVLDATSVLAAARAARVDEVVTAYTPVGPIAETLAAMEPLLAEAGVTLVQRRRTWDELFWPHATKGFFALKEQIPAVLAEEGLRA